MEKESNIGQNHSKKLTKASRWKIRCKELPVLKCPIPLFLTQREIPNGFPEPPLLSCKHPMIVKIGRIGAVLLATGALAFLPFAAAPFAAIGIGAFFSIGFLFFRSSSRSLPQSNSIGSLSHLDWNVDSSRLLIWKGSAIDRNSFLRSGSCFPSPVIGKSSFVSEQMVEHLMRNKKDRALGQKYVPGDEITNMEGALHTFVTPVCPILMTGDFRWMGKLQGSLFGANKVRPVILSGAIHPDFEFDTVMMRLVRLGNEPVEGKTIDLEGPIPSAEQKKNPSFLQEYEETLRKHMIYHLVSSHRLPALQEINEEDIFDLEGAKHQLEQLLLDGGPPSLLEGKFGRVGGAVISLEMLFQTYLHQIQNEFRALNQNPPKNGYLYTIHPPSIFARSIQGAVLLNRLQALAFRSLSSTPLFSHVKAIAVSDYQDPGIVALWKKALPRMEILREEAIFDSEGRYRGAPGAFGAAWVRHNNSDGFGQNIETEGPSSLDGVIGSYSNGAEVLRRDRKELLDTIV